MGIAEDREMLLSKLSGAGYLRSQEVSEALRLVPREEFVNDSDRLLAYSDYPLEIGFGQTISAPHMVAMMTELLKPRKRDRVLEIGSGSGYQAAVLSLLASEVYTVEVEPDLALVAKENLQKAGRENVRVFVGDGSAGYPYFAPYDRIIVTCATERIYDSWKKQLKPGGIIVAPVGGFYMQTLVSLRKKRDGVFERDEHGNCRFVPLRRQ